MTNHHQPTREELKANMNASLEKLKTLPPEGDPLKSDPPAGDPPAPTTPTPPTPPSGDPLTPPAGDPPAPPAPPSGDPPNPPTPPAPPAGDPPINYEEKFKQSSREAQVMGFKNKEINEAIEKAGALPPPTDEEMKSLYPNWDEIDDVTKGLAKDNLLNKRKFELIQGATAKFKEVDAWNTKVDEFVKDPAVLVNHPELEGKTDAFKEFASKPSRRGVDLEDLILAFQGEKAKTQLPPKNGEMFPTGGSRSATPPVIKDDTLSPAEGAALMKTDYKKYVTLLKAGKIRNL